MTWLDKVAMVPSVVMGVTREALELSTVPPARLVEAVPVTVPKVVTPTRTGGDTVFCMYNLKYTVVIGHLNNFLCVFVLMQVIRNHQ